MGPLVHLIGLIPGLFFCLMYCNASFQVDERVKEAPRGDREIIVENVDSERPCL